MRDLPTQPPPDADHVIAVFRFGWGLAELRGRYRPGAEHAATLEAPEQRRNDRALPLAYERSWDEQRIETLGVVTQLGAALELDFTSTAKGTMTGRFQACAERLDQGANDRQAWKELTELIYEWDAQIQDTLVMRPSDAAAYQLGRGLAETYWALDPTVTDPQDWRSWEFLLGERRRTALTRLTQRLSAYLPPLTPPAIERSLEEWAAVANDRTWRGQSDATKMLFQQSLLWRDLVRGERDPEDLLQSGHLLARVGMLWPVLKSFWVQILFGVAGIALLAAGGAVLAGGGDQATATVATILGFFGLTSAGLYARAKAAANSLIAQFKSVFDADLVGRLATLLPKAEGKTAARKRMADTLNLTVGRR